MTSVKTHPSGNNSRNLRKRSGHSTATDVATEVNASHMKIFSFRPIMLSVVYLLLGFFLTHSVYTTFFSPRTTPAPSVLAPIAKDHQANLLQSRMEQFFTEWDFTKVQYNNITIYHATDNETNLLCRLPVADKVCPQPEDFQRVVILVPGASAIIPGVWSRRLSIHKSLGVGSMIPYIEPLFWSAHTVVVVLQPITNEDDYFESAFQWVADRCDIPYNGVDIIAHSCGGTVALKALEKLDRSRIHTVNLLDSVHEEEPEIDGEWLRARVVNWVVGDETGFEVRVKGNIHTMPAGTDIHGEVPWTVIRQVLIRVMSPRTEKAEAVDLDQYKAMKL
ncbi:hypothetical protein HDV00_000441 [Rhizophlyctis rosea]|nr:hypothetical protein HDV00_000441 [Rhizophlyctis rosea]